MPTPNASFISRLVRWRLLIVVNLLVIVFLGMSLGREVVRSRSISAQIAGLEAQAQALAAQNINLGELKTAMQTESYIEREARLKLGMKKPGESVVVIQDDLVQQEQGQDASDPLGYIITDEQEFKSVANTTKWWYYFFDKNLFNAL